MWSGKGRVLSGARFLTGSLGLACLVLLSCGSAGPGIEIRVGRAGTDAPNAFCEDFRLTAAQVRSFFDRAIVMTAGEIHDSFDWLPCWVDGEIVEGGTIRTWRIRPTGIAEVRGPDGVVVLYGCKNCEDIFR